MTSVEVLGKIRHNGSDELLIEVDRSYKNREGIIEKDLLPCIHWTRSKRNIFQSLANDTKVFVKGRLETEDGKMILVIEEYMTL